jgi:hypothetical protein
MISSWSESYNRLLAEQFSKIALAFVEVTFFGRCNVIDAAEFPPYHKDEKVAQRYYCLECYVERAFEIH